MAHAHAHAADKYYVPHGSPWPIFGRSRCSSLMAGAVATLERLAAGLVADAGIRAAAGAVLRAGSAPSSARTSAASTTWPVDRSFRMGMMWFIFSEVMFFAAFFGALFYARHWRCHGWRATARSPSTALLWKNYEGGWPTNGPAALGPRADGSFETIPALGLPAINTAILLSSGVTVTIAHHALHRRPSRPC